MEARDEPTVDHVGDAERLLLEGSQAAEDRGDLDEARNLRDASRLVVAAMQARYADATGHFGPYGGRFVPEALVGALDELFVA